MARAVAAEEVRPDELQLCAALQTVNAFLPHLRTAQDEEEAVAALWSALIEVVGRHRVGHRPDRVEPRGQAATEKLPEAERLLRPRAAFTQRCKAF